jgi:dGTPase
LAFYPPWLYIGGMVGKPSKPFGDKAIFACDPARSRGRLFPEDESSVRDAFQRDRDRIIHAGAFRRLKHKTQVFMSHEGDYYRTRLTHSLEVAQISRTVCRYLGLNEDLGEALALAHDFGHPPFGHAGEDALSGCMQAYGGFDHNLHSLRLLTDLEQRYADFDGLNLTWETLEGIAKHNGPLGAKGMEDLLDPLLTAYLGRHDLEIHTFASAEAQVAAQCDDIAYNNHDIDDGLRAELFTLDDLADVPLVGDMLAEVRKDHPTLNPDRTRFELVRHVIDAMVRDLVAETITRLKDANPQSDQDIRNLRRPVVAFSVDMQAHEKAIKAFLMTNMYRHERVAEMANNAKRVVADLFSRYMAEPDCLPDEWQAKVADGTGDEAARTIADFIAGMTDRFAFKEHDRLFGEA